MRIFLFLLGILPFLTKCAEINALEDTFTQVNYSDEELGELPSMLSIADCVIPCGRPNIEQMQRECPKVAFVFEFFPLLLFAIGLIITVQMGDIRAFFSVGSVAALIEMYLRCRCP